MPDAFAQRMQKLTPFLMTVRHGAGIPFLLPLLLQVLGTSEESSPTTQAAWLHVLMDQEVGASIILCLLQDPVMCLRDMQHTELAQKLFMSTGPILALLGVQGMTRKAWCNAAG